MEINLNCDLGEKSIHYDGKYDANLLKIINSANIAAKARIIKNNTARRTYGSLMSAHK